MTQNTNPPANEAQWQAARAGTPDEPAPAAGHQAEEGKGKGDGRPSNLVLAGAGSLLAVLAFLGGTAVGHAWDGSSTQQNQFGGPGGGGGRQFPGQQGQQGQVPGQGTNGQGQGQGTVPGQGNQPSTGTGQTQTS
ncbi:hypothetical protein ACGFIF_21085 [Kribbella sp. NPDC049174]|uniref:hypothetical protein n=1 Tax=Kribbella sp. NPDC049174 TaxID=3364112 RepID=UPI00371CAE5E